MSLLYLNTQALGIATLLIMLGIAIMLAWLIGFIIGRERRRVWENRPVMLNSAPIATPAIPPPLPKIKPIPKPEPLPDPVEPTPDPSPRGLGWAHQFRRVMMVLSLVSFLGLGGWLADRTWLHIFNHSSASAGGLISDTLDNVDNLAEAAGPARPTDSPVDSLSPTPSANSTSTPSAAATILGPLAQLGPLVPHPAAPSTDQTYDNQTLGIHFTYPSGWQIKPFDPTWGVAYDPAILLLFRLHPPTSQGSVSPVLVEVQVDPNPNHQTVTDWVKLRFSLASQHGQKSVTIGDQSAEQLDYINTKEAKHKRITILGYNDRIYTFMLSGPVDLPVTDPNWLAAQKLVATIQLH